MIKEYRARTFKSGNSVALRLPKALGLKEGAAVVLREDHGTFSFEPVPDVPKKIDLTGIYGSIPGLQALSAEERMFEERELDWDGKRLKGE